MLARISVRHNNSTKNTKSKQFDLHDQQVLASKATLISDHNIDQGSRMTARRQLAAAALAAAPTGYHSLSPTEESIDQLISTSSASSSGSTSRASSLSNATTGSTGADPDPLRSSVSINTHSNISHIKSANLPVSPSKSPILIKYNYYDYNGSRQEQTNYDMNHQQHQQQQQVAAAARIQRNLSPTFKQSLDQIVRNTQQLQQLTQSQQQQQQVNKNSPSPEYQQHLIHFARRYKLSSYEQRCLRCNKTVYQMDKVGPLKDFTFYHQNCFKCRECGTKLTLKTYFNNQQSSNDHEVYCHRHCPKTGPGKLDNQSVGIRAALNAPKVFDVSAHLPPSVLLTGAQLAHELENAENIANGLQPNKSGHLINQNIIHNNQANDFSQHHQPQVDSSALYIQHAVQQTRLQNIYKQSQVDKKISQFINRRLEFLEPKQKMLEMRHREEEDALFKTFEQKWRQEESCISEQIREEWEIELSKLLEKYKRQLSNISNSSSSAVAVHHQQQQQQIKLNDDRKMKNLLLKQLSEGNELNKQQMIEFERMNLEKTMTIKLDRKKETLKRKLKEFERQATAELVEKQSREMLALISMKLDEYKEEQKRKIGSDLEQFEAIESLANQLGSSLQFCSVKSKTEDPAKEPAGLFRRAPDWQNTDHLSPTNQQVVAPVTGANNKQVLDTPSPKAPQVSKMELYNNEEPDEVFREIDQLAINVAKEDQQSFTDLVHHLTRNCLTDIEKVRAIFRWITVKNLNTMKFDSSVKPDTPLGLLRGIKNGSESYHVLFKRLCSYAGLHCVVIKGYSKSAGYQPGVKFEGNRFRNSWNAVYVAGAWRFVQCNWGARHLVSVAVMQDKNQPLKKFGADHPADGALHSRALAVPLTTSSKTTTTTTTGRSQQQQQPIQHQPVHGRRALASTANNLNHHHPHLVQPNIQSESANNNGNTFDRPSGHQLKYKQQQQQQPYLQASGSPISPQHHFHQHHKQLHNALSSPSSSSSSGSTVSQSTSSSSKSGAYFSSTNGANKQQQQQVSPSSSGSKSSAQASNTSDSLRYEYDDHYFLTDPDEFIYEFFPLNADWQLLKSRAISLSEFEQLPFVRSLFFKYGLYFPQSDIRSVLHTDSSGATTIKIGMPTHMIPSLIFHYNLKYFNSDLEHYDGVNLKRFVMQSVESGTSDSSNGQVLLSNIVTFRVHLPENGAYILDIFANSTTPTQYITGEPMKFKSVCKFKIIAKNLRTVMIPLPDCASGEYGPMKATRLFGIIPLTHESGLISVQNDKRFLEIQFRMTRPLLDFMASLHKNGYDERQLSKSIKIFLDGDIVFVTVKFFEDGQYGLDIYTRDHMISNGNDTSPLQPTTDRKKAPSTRHDDNTNVSFEPKKQLLTHCCKYLINVRTLSTANNINNNNNNNRL